MREQRIEIAGSEQPHFIGAWSSLPERQCAEMIEFFENHPDAQFPGRLGSRVDEQSKKSIDLGVDPLHLERPDYALFKPYFDQLQACFRDYVSQWEFLETFIGPLQIGSFNLQKYETGGHFSKLHSERTSIRYLPRLLVWMTYLNDVEEGGETEFPMYGLKIKPAAGKTVIWPAEWTHAHRGCPVLSGEKYIITGWFHTPAEE